MFLILFHVTAPFSAVILSAALTLFKSMDPVGFQEIDQEYNGT